MTNHTNLKCSRIGDWVVITPHRRVNIYIYNRMTDSRIGAWLGDRIGEWGYELTELFTLGGPFPESGRDLCTSGGIYVVLSVHQLFQFSYIPPIVG